MIFTYNTHTQQQSGLSRLEYIIMKAIQEMPIKDGKTKLNRQYLGDTVGINRSTANNIVQRLTDSGFLESIGFSVKVLIQV